MSKWQDDLKALVAESTEFVKAVDWETNRPAPPRREDVERVGLKPLDYGKAERAEIARRVETFRAHQERFDRERKEFAAAALKRALKS
ncbi:hypothetical protein QY049_37470 [Bradyrhizobium sp. WYCCWR 13022]|uniref:hypothetical protein n=1 Tax=unclassified Bradyrhizobium TaxID=2631580 RepID=UPI00263B3483|nr:hypothetical protein [Bradyrhizobium sp. WYCCWR 13022]MDN4982302.1 hypothetical protein [Bradyrhizobium sp. WYCCWR 13022]MDN4988839.1 hypothetical protein [Bradyrhizobium sp. WYCCWR 13022]